MVAPTLCGQRKLQENGESLSFDPHQLMRTVVFRVFTLPCSSLRRRKDLHPRVGQHLDFHDQCDGT